MLRQFHRLKTWPEHFQAVVSGEKTFELRKNDRNFEVGDELCLHEFCPQSQEYSGNHIWVYVSHILRGGQFGLPDDMCIMSLGDHPTIPKIK